MRIQKGDANIHTVEDWRSHAPPEHENQWAAGRSAQCMAETWTAEAPPEAVRALLEDHADFGAFAFDEAIAEPECRIPFDAYGRPRQADLAFTVRDARGTVAVTVEGKADEPFDQYLGRTLADAVDRGLAGPSNGVRRVEDLAASLLPPRKLGSDVPVLPALHQLRYQLLTAVAGTVAYAAGRADRAVLIVEEFATVETREDRRQRNHEDLDRFVHRLTAGQRHSVAPGELIGPVVIPGGPLFSEPAELYLGMVVHDLS